MVNPEKGKLVEIYHQFQSGGNLPPHKGKTRDVNGSGKLPSPRETYENILRKFTGGFRRPTKISSGNLPDDIKGQTRDIVAKFVGVRWKQENLPNAEIGNGQLMELLSLPSLQYSPLFPCCGNYWGFCGCCVMNSFSSHTADMPCSWCRPPP